MTTSNISFPDNSGINTDLTGQVSSSTSSNSSILDSIQSASLTTTSPTALVSASTPVLARPQISIVEFYKLVGTATLNNKNSIYEAYAKQAQLLNALFTYMNQLGLGVTGVTDAINSARDQQQQIYDDAAALTTQENSIIQEYNGLTSNINQSISAFNNAVSQHNQGNMSDQDFQAAVDTYNTQIAAYNQQLQDLRNRLNQSTDNKNLLNQRINDLNEQLRKLGVPQAPTLTPNGPIPTLPSVTIETTQLVTPLSDLNLLSIPSNLNPASWYDDLESLLGPDLSKASEVFSYNAEWQNIINQWQDIQYYLKGKSVVLPNAYMSENLATNSTGITPSGQAFTDTAVITQLQQVNNVVGNTIMKSILKEYDIYLNPKLYDQVKQVVVGALLFNGLVGPSAAMAIYADRLALQEKDSLSFTTSSAIGFANGILSFVSQNALKPAISNIVGSSDTPAGKAAATQINAAVNAGLLNAALAALSDAFKLPGLTPQVLANVRGVNQEILQEAAAPSSTATSALGNPMSVTLARQTLVNSLGAAQTVNANRLESAIDNAIGKLGPYSTESTIRETLRAEFANQGFGETNSLAIANNYIALLKAENNPEIETALQAGSVNNTAVISGLSSSLMSRGFTAAAAASISQTAVIDALNQPFESVRGFRDNLLNQLNQQGIAPSLSATLSHVGATIASGQTASFGNNLNVPALTSSLNSQLSAIGSNASASEIASKMASSQFSDEGSLRENLQSHLSAAGLSSQNAQDIAHSVVVSNTGGSLSSRGLGQVMTPNQIATEVRQNMGQSLSQSMNSKMADKISQEVTHTLFGNRQQQASVDRRNPSSFTSLMEQQLDVLKGHGDVYARETDKIHNPTLNMNAFLAAVQDPGRNLVITQVGAITQLNPPESHSLAPEPTIGVKG